MRTHVILLTWKILNMKLGWRSHVESRVDKCKNLSFESCIWVVVNMSHRWEHCNRFSSNNAFILLYFCQAGSSILLAMDSSLTEWCGEWVHFGLFIGGKFLFCLQIGFQVLADLSSSLLRVGPMACLVCGRWAHSFSIGIIWSSVGLGGWRHTCCGPYLDGRSASCRIIHWCGRAFFL